MMLTYLTIWSFGYLDVSSCAIGVTDRAILNRKRIESRDWKPIAQVKVKKALTAIRPVFGLAIQDI